MQDLVRSIQQLRFVSNGFYVQASESDINHSSTFMDVAVDADK